MITELFSDFGVVLGNEEDEVEGADAAERAGAIALLRALRLRKVVVDEPPPPPPLTVGAQVLAVLEEDGGCSSIPAGCCLSAACFLLQGIRSHACWLQGSGMKRWLRLSCATQPTTDLHEC